MHNNDVRSVSMCVCACVRVRIEREMIPRPRGPRTSGAVRAYYSTGYARIVTIPAIVVDVRPSSVHRARSQPVDGKFGASRVPFGFDRRKSPTPVEHHPFGGTPSGVMEDLCFFFFLANVSGKQTASVHVPCRHESEMTAGLKSFSRLKRPVRYDALDASFFTETLSLPLHHKRLPPRGFRRF